MVDGVWIAVVKEGMNDRVSVGGVVGLGRGTSMEKFPVGTSADTDVLRASSVAAAFSAALLAARFSFRRSLFRWSPVRVATVAEPEDAPGSAVAAAGRAMGVVFLFRRRGQSKEDERCPTVLQVRQVLGERIHHACTFSPKTSKSVGASS